VALRIPPSELEQLPGDELALLIDLASQ